MKFKVGDLVRLNDYYSKNEFGIVVDINNKYNWIYVKFLDSDQTVYRYSENFFEKIN